MYQGSASHRKSKTFRIDLSLYAVCSCLCVCANVCIYFFVRWVVPEFAILVICTMSDYIHAYLYTKMRLHLFISAYEHMYI
jgi:hypothetical protein